MAKYEHQLVISMGMFTYVRARVWLGLLHRLSPFIAPSVTAVRVPSPGLLLLFAIRTLWVGCWFHLLVCLCVCVCVRVCGGPGCIHAWEGSVGGHLN